MGNFPWATTEDDLRDLLSDFGKPNEVRIMRDHDTNKSKGYAFADMARPAAEAAIRALDGMDYGGRRLTVNEAKPRHRESRGERVLAGARR